MNETLPTFWVFFDGLCPLCSREIDHYRHCSANDSTVVYVDIASNGFDAATYGLEPSRVHQEMHVKEGDKVFVGVDAFLAIWRRVPGHRWLISLARLPLADSLMRVGYFIFAKAAPVVAS
jgi:predicted DCC family thiol-disulfide oxidoreductase YuxK